VSRSLGSTFKIGWSLRLQPPTLHFTKDMVLPPYSVAGASFLLKQFGQYQGSGVWTGFGLRLRHLAQRKPLPFTAVFGRTFFPVLRMLFAIGTSTRILVDCVTLAAIVVCWHGQRPSRNASSKQMRKMTAENTTQRRNIIEEGVG
jgi:hypothetical protein